MRRFFCPQLFIVNEVVQLVEAEARHLGTVLRASVGEQISLLNGEGQKAVAEILSISGKKNNTVVDLKILEVESFEKKKVTLSLFVACPRTVPMEMVLKQAVELGVDEIFPIITEFTVSKPKDKSEKWHQAIIEACKQSGNPFKPILHPVKKFSEAVSIAPKKGVVGAVPLDDFNSSLELGESKEENLAVWIGPEGGFSEPELNALFDNNQFQNMPLTVGQNILRLETAVVAVVSVLLDRLGY